MVKTKKTDNPKSQRQPSTALNAPPAVNTRKEVDIPSAAVINQAAINAYNDFVAKSVLFSDEYRPF